MNVKKLLKPLVLALAAGSFTVAAVAQWQWIDKDGRKVFSDQSPPPDILEKNILKRPASASRAAAPVPVATASASAATASAPKISGKDSELEAKKKKADEEAAAKKKAEEEKVAKAKAEYCDRAKGALTTLQSGVRMSGMNSKGEREVFDDERRALETKRAQESIASNCK
jgi:hypothetical protein